jgi:antitoxin ParD1/3/4
MELTLSNETERLIDESIRSGRHQSASEVVAFAVKNLVECERRIIAYNEYLKREVAIGIAELDRGEGIEYTEETLHELFDEIEQRIDRELARRQAHVA